jgi:hypothetical protein
MNRIDWRLRQLEEAVAEQVEREDPKTRIRDALDLARMDFTIPTPSPIRERQLARIERLEAALDGDAWKLKPGDTDILSPGEAFARDAMEG